MKKAFLYVACVIFAAGLAFAGTISNVHLSGSSPYCLASSVTISWTATGVSQQVKIQLVKEGGGFTELIATGLSAASGSYVWTAGQYQGGTASPADNYRIRVATLDNAAANKSPSFELKSCTVDPGILAKLRHMRLMIKWPPDPDPCLCPEIFLDKLRDMLGNVRGDLKLVLLKNGDKVQELGVFGRGKAMPNSIKPSLSAENYGLLTKGGAAFSLGLLNEKGIILQNIALEGAEQKAIIR